MRKGQFSAMYKKALSGLLTINLLFLLGVLSLCRMEDIGQKMQQAVRQTQAEERLLADRESMVMGIASRTSSGQRVVDCNELQRNSKYQLTEKELDTCQKELFPRIRIQLDSPTHLAKCPVLSVNVKDRNTALKKG